MDKIFELLRAIQEGSAHNQRDLAKLAGFSLAMVNTLMKRMQNRDLVVFVEGEIPYQLTEKGKQFLDNLLREKTLKKTNLQIPKKETLNTAVILAAGHNPNFEVPICLLELKDNMTIIDRLMIALEEQGIKDMIVVIGYKKEMVMEHLKHKNVTFVVNDRYQWTGTMASLALAAPYIKQDFLVVEGDHVFEKRMLDKAIHSEERSCVVVKTPEGSGHDAYVEFDSEGYINRISKDTHQFNHLHGILAGFHKLSSELFHLMMERYKDNSNPYLNYEYVIENLAHSYKIPSLYIDDAISYDINDGNEFEKLLGVHYPILMKRELQRDYDDLKLRFCEIMNLDIKDILSIEYAGGMTNVNFKIDMQEQSYIFRIPGKCTDTMISRKNEGYNSKLGYLLDLNVDTVYFDEVQGIKITKYVDDAETLSQATARLEINIAETTKLMRKLHDSNAELQSSFNVFDELIKYEELTEAANGNYYDGYEDLRIEFFKCQDRLDKIGLDVKPCHNDLVAENFIKNSERMYLIDWEYAGMNDPMWDIASHLIECNFTKEDAALFLQYYFEGGKPTIAQEKKIMIFMILQDILWAVWTCAKEANGEDFGTYGLERLTRAKKMLQLYIERYEKDGNKNE